MFRRNNEEKILKKSLKKWMRYEKWSLFPIFFFLILFIRLHLYPFLKFFFFHFHYYKSFSCKCVKFLSQFCLNSLNFHFWNTISKHFFRKSWRWLRVHVVYTVHCTCQVNRKIKKNEYGAAPTKNFLQSRFSPHIADINWIGNRRYDETINFQLIRFSLSLSFGMMNEWWAFFFFFFIWYMRRRPSQTLNKINQISLEWAQNFTVD